MCQYNIENFSEISRNSIAVGLTVIEGVLAISLSCWLKIFIDSKSFEVKVF